MKKEIRIYYISVFLFLFSIHHVFAQSDSDNEEQLAQTSLQDLLTVMEESTKIATKTKLNADFVPGMVTVLKGNDLESRGIHILKEALKLIPGITETKNNLAIAVRGIENWSSGKLKLLLNDIPYNETLAGEGSSLYFLPIEMIDRIEVIRGPGSALYGEYAFSGVINVITHQDERRVFSRYGSFATFAGGGNFFYAQDDWHTNISLSGWDSDGADSLVEKDALSGLSSLGLDSISYAPGFSNERARSRNAILSIGYQNTSLVFQYLNGQAGDGVGYMNMLPAQDKRLVLEDRNTQLEIKHEFELLPKLPVNIKAGLMDYLFVIDRTFFAPPGFNTLRVDSNADGSLLGSAQAKERKWYTSLAADWEEWDHHIFSIGIDWATIELYDVWTLGNQNLKTGASMATMAFAQQENNWVLQDFGKRKITGVMLQDQWKITDDLTSTFGLRYDRYSDVGDSLTPRFAMVYRLTDNHILKVQYGSAFRPPTFSEMYSNNLVIQTNSAITPEIIRTVDLGYIYRAEDIVSRITLFHSSLKDMIDLKMNALGMQRYENVADVDLNGIELELEKKLTHRIKLDTNLSYVTTQDKTMGGEFPGSTNWVGNLGLVFQPWSDYSIALQARHVGTRNRGKNDPRDKLAGYHTVDITATIFNLAASGFTLRGGAKNVFDADTRESTSDIITEYESFGIPAYPAYPNDFQRPGRELWMTISYHF